MLQGCAFCSVLARPDISVAGDGVQARREVAEEGRLVGELESTDVGGPRLDRRKAGHHVVQVRVRVDPAWQGQAQELEGRGLLLLRHRVAAEQERADLHATHAALQVQLAGQRVGGEGGGRDVGQQLARVDEDRVASGGGLDGDARGHQALTYTTARASRMSVSRPRK